MRAFLPSRRLKVVPGRRSPDLNQWSARRLITLSPCLPEVFDILPEFIREELKLSCRSRIAHTFVSSVVGDGQLRDAIELTQHPVNGGCFLFSAFAAVGLPPYDQPAQNH